MTISKSALGTSWIVRDKAGLVVFRGTYDECMAYEG